MVRVSRSVRDLAYKVLAVREKALRENKKEPTIDEIAKELGVEKEENCILLGCNTRSGFTARTSVWR